MEGEPLSNLESGREGCAAESITRQVCDLRVE
jgi:hypothetical protein